jgi:hypothetical protein
MTERRAYRYYDLVMVAFVTVLVCSNLIGPAKIAQLDLPLVGVLTFGAGVLFFPISYVFGDILTEVYGYARSRRVIWSGFDGVGHRQTPAGFLLEQPGRIRDRVRLHLAHRVGFADRVPVRRVRQLVRARQDENLDRGALAVDAHHRLDAIRRRGGFAAVLSARVLWQRHHPQRKAAAGDGVEVVFTPVTYKIVAALKRAEHEDYYDIDTDFNPFTLKA